MNLDLSIYHRILFNDLRPWLPLNQSENKFKEKLIPAFKTLHIDPQTIEKTIDQVLKDYPNSTIENQYVTEVDATQEEIKNIQNEIFQPLITIYIHKPFNPKAEFYYYLIINAGTVFINNLNKAIHICKNQKEQKFLINTVYRQITYFLNEVNKKFKVDKVDTKKSSDDYILAVLKITLVRLAFEIQELFPELVASKIVTEDEIYNSDTYEIAPSVKYSKDLVMMNDFKVRKYISSKTHSKKEIVEYISKTLEILVKDYNEKIKDTEKAKSKEILLQNIEALENLYYILYSKNIGEDAELSYKKLTSEEYSDIVLSTVNELISDKLEEETLPNKRLSIINKQEELLIFLKPEIDFDTNNLKQSIPRRVLLILEGNKNFLKANLSIDFSKLTKGNDLRLKTNLSVPEIALLFKALKDLKPEIFDVKTDTDLYKFISSNFITKQSKEEGISVGKLRKLFAEPKAKAVDFWQKHFSTLMVEVKKYK